MSFLQKRVVLTKLTKLLKIFFLYYLFLLVLTSVSAYLEVKTSVKPLSFIGSAIIFPASSRCEDLEFTEYKKGIVVTELVFTPSNVSCLTRTLEDKEWLVVMISNGGSIMASRHLKSFLNKKDIHTHFEYVCFSACVELLSSAKKSSAGEGLFLADHKGAVNVSIPYLLTPLNTILNWVSVEMLTQSGIPRHEVNRVTETTNMKEVPHEQLVSLGYVNKITKLNNLSFYRNKGDAIEYNSVPKTPYDEKINIMDNLASKETQNSLFQTSTKTLMVISLFVFLIIILLLLVARFRRPIE